MFEKKKKPEGEPFATPKLPKAANGGFLNHQEQVVKPAIGSENRLGPKHLNDWQWFHDADALCEDGDWDAAEEIYVAVGEQTYLGKMSSSAINCLVFSILIPQKRFVEARAWLHDSMDLEVAWEAWNSLENLAELEYAAGNNELADRYLQQIIDADDGPVEGSEKLLEKIRAGKFAKPVARLNLEYSEEWRQVDVSGPLDPKSTQREFYLRLIKFMHESNQQFSKETFKQSSGAFTTGFANGILTQELIDLGFSRDTAAKACLDYFNYVQMGNNPEEDPYAAGLEYWKKGKKRKALSKLRIAARQGNVDAMVLVAQGVEEKFGKELALPWYRLASANGSSEADAYLMDTSSVSWDEDDDDDDDDDEDDDEQEQQITNLGPRFCTNCGNARATGAKFCTNCGTAIE